MKNDQENQENQEDQEENNRPLLNNEQNNMNVVQVLECNKEKDESISAKTEWDFLYGLSLFGRLIFTLYSLHGLFFIYNLIIQFLVAFPSLVYTGEIPWWATYIFFSFTITKHNSNNISRKHYVTYHYY